MTNQDKFKEVFGFTPDKDTCVAPQNMCQVMGFQCTTHKGECVFHNWWNREYKPCFELKEGING